MYESKTLAHPAADPQDANRYFLTKLSLETDVADVIVDLQNGPLPYVLLDARSTAHFEAGHVPGAVSLPQTQITAETTAHFDRQRLIVTYCWGPACNGATKAAAKLSALGFQVKEMIGGFEYWQKEGGPVAYQ
ncbi:rhodanese-like domain-containing protein [Tumebacillus sp. ITR2]|uniref:Rhodanese-like domain-containing protein n=1 Tax=Tumebacillus amylolyticus TaxID=2801339 RepID=A0ABS1J823_9BACL|nr:rhodanese-like domain-containing protein [Tumebacillus amylolyticus]MBL0386345.1 rhodanese-like domain-containing protein [Tumebacillus amylolyticus]